MRVTDTHIYFWGKSEIYSNFHEAHFTHDDFKFVNSEQAFMYEKAMFFDDTETAQLILQEKKPEEIKKLGRLVKNFSDIAWSEVRYKCMTEVLYAKFSQNPFYHLTLLQTGDKILVEASPYDKIWGVGLGENDDKILDEKNWLGHNLLGKALMEVRTKLQQHL